MVGGLLAGRYCREVGDNALQCAPSLLFLKEMFQTPKREKSRTLSSKFKGGSVKSSAQVLLPTTSCLYLYYSPTVRQTEI
jgi:hypothetical protein